MAWLRRSTLDNDGNLRVYHFQGGMDGWAIVCWFPVLGQMEDSEDSCDKKIQMTQTQSSSDLTKSTSATRLTKTIWVFRILPSMSPNA